MRSSRFVGIAAGRLSERDPRGDAKCLRGLVVEAVSRNRSPLNISLFSGNLTGKFAIFRPWRRFHIGEAAVPQRFFTKFPKTINRVKLSDNRDRNRVNSEIQSEYQKRPFPHIMIAQALLLDLPSRRKSDLSEKLGPSERGRLIVGQVAGAPQLAAPAL